MSTDAELATNLHGDDLSAYSLSFTSECLGSLDRLPNELKQRVSRVVFDLVRLITDHPGRVVPRGAGFAYRHPEPRVELTYCVDKKRRVIVATWAAVTLLRRLLIFVSYSHRDRKDLAKVKKFFNRLESEGNVREWDDSRIRSGEEWALAIDEALAGASLAVLLVTQEFLDSQFIREHELPALYRYRALGRMEVNWIPLRPSTVHHTWLGEIQALCPTKPTLHELKLVDRERVLVDIYDKLKGICERLAPSIAVDSSLAADVGHE